jgi:hypothetical protein
MSFIAYDIETYSLPESVLADRVPKFEGNANTKDPAKIEAQIAEKRARWFEDAALSATTGRVLIIGTLRSEDGAINILSGDEVDILRAFWQLCETVRLPFATFMVGFNSDDFDLPFLVQRSWALNVEIPWWVMTGRHFDGQFVDLMKRWLCGRRDFTGQGLDAVSAALGCGRTFGDGKDFGRLWFGSPEEKAQAILHLETDLRCTASIAARMGIGRAGGERKA